MSLDFSIANTLRIWSIAILYILVSERSALPTSIAVMRRPTYVVLASDSGDLGFLNGSWVKSSICKISFVGDQVVAIAGVRDDKMVDYDSVLSVQQVLQKFSQSTTDELAKRIVKTIRPKLLHSLQVRHLQVPHDYATLIAPKDNVLGIVILKMDGKIPKVISIKLDKRDDARGNPISLKDTIETCPGPACPTGSRYFILGQVEAISRKLSGTEPFWTGNDVADLRKIVEIEIADKPRDVAPPITILYLDASGFHWINKGVCH